jgi:hypothetical protein
MTIPASARRNARKLLGILLFLAAGSLLGYALGTLVKPSADTAAELSTPAKAARVAALVGVAYLGVAAHELGHVVGGLSQGFAFLFWAAGPLWVERSRGRLHVRLNRTPATWGGVAATMPRDARDLARRFAVVVASGPLASLLLAVVGALAWLALPDGLARFAAGSLAVVSAALFLATAQPFGAGSGFHSDGGRLRRLLSRGELAEQEAAMLALMSFAMSGVRPRDWPAATLATASSVADSSALEAAVALVAAQYALDTGRPEDAHVQLERGLSLGSRIGPLARAPLAAEAAFFFAWVRRDAVRARALLADAHGPFVERHRVARAEAATRLAEGNLEGAREAARRALGEAERPRFEANPMDLELSQAVLEAATLPPAG